VKTARSLLFIAGVTFAAPILTTVSTRAAQTSFDGSWSILVVTNAGHCDRAYRYAVTIRNGTVLYEGSAAVKMTGKVKGNGQVDVSVRAGSQGATGTGRLLRDYGTGRWHGISSSGSCAGTWSAERR
jgi:outer membrane protein assembly factor BamB